MIILIMQKFLPPLKFVGMKNISVAAIMGLLFENAKKNGACSSKHANRHRGGSRNKIEGGFMCRPPTVKLAKKKGF